MPAKRMVLGKKLHSEDLSLHRLRLVGPYGLWLVGLGKTSRYGTAVPFCRNTVFTRGAVRNETVVLCESRHHPALFLVPLAPMLLT
jgi:hypothetical protein